MIRGAIIVTSTIALLALAGGGGSSSGGGGGGGGFSSGGGSSYSSHGSGGGGGDVISFLAVTLIIFVVVIIVKRSDRKSKTKKSGVVSGELSDTEKKAKEIFLRYQADWSKNDVEAMRPYMTPEYHHRAELMIKALREQERRNEVRDPNPGSVVTVQSISDSSNIYITFKDASADDVLIDVSSDKILKQGRVDFSETWEFVQYENGELKLTGTDPGTISQKMLVDSMRGFAAQHKLEYFPDWGTLTLPTRGVIFNKGSFAYSDINNYMVGEYGGQLVQMYSYTPNVNVQVNNKPYPIYLVGQIAVPGKNYGGIIVMKNKLIDRKPKGYQKYNLEWTDFNKKYDVFATDIDKVTSFELLHPAFMAFLHDQVNLDLTLEVVDNVIYFYIKIGTDVKHYETLLEVLLRAHKELKM
ncbi:hypothetical protein FWD20_01370 [Candidatus Saccharibacteria bacterium]|nr:hypothetical protein [Candidatus Saccharibacteria bacterium]